MHIDIDIYIHTYIYRYIYLSADVVSFGMRRSLLYTSLYIRKETILYLVRQCAEQVWSLLEYIGLFFAQICFYIYQRRPNCSWCASAHSKCGLFW